jgi:hypothetical protein
MADDVNVWEIVEAYHVRFGNAGDFDRWILPSDANVDLMRRALERDSPVTRADLEAEHQRLYDRPLDPDPPADAVR